MSEDGIVNRSEILPLMGVVKRQGEWMIAYCPAHADGKKHNGKGGQSLALSDKGVLRCWAGCSFKDVMAALRAAGGVREDAPRSTQRPVETDRWPHDPVVAYEYIHPETGKLLAVKGRFERPDPAGGKPEKTFRWRLPEGTYRDGLGGSLPMKDLPLWGAVELAASPPAMRVWFTEGEKAATAIRARNELAVCGAWGASQRDFGVSLNILAGRTVYLWPDNDQPGREYMAEIRKALKGIAASIAVINAPVPPKGDAHEYFAAGGTVEGLLANTLDRPTVDIITVNHCAVRLPTDEGPVRFDFDRIQRSSGVIDCEMVVTHTNPAYESEPYATRINLLSASARSQLETALRKQFAPSAVNWTTMVSAAFARARQAHNEIDRTAHISALPDMERPTFLIDTLLPEGTDTILFGDGSSGKTFLAYAMGLQVAVGGRFCGMKARMGGVIILDYETGEAMVKFRMKRVMLGAGVDPVLLPELPIHYMDAGGVPLPEMIESLKRAIDRHDVKLVIIDAAGDACGGEPEKAGVVLNYFNACAELKATKLHIAHVTNSEMEVSAKRPFGSRYWHNRARRTWFVKRDQEEESDQVDVGLTCRKANDGRLPKPLAFRVDFEGDSGAVRITAQSFNDVAAFESDQTVADRVTSFLLGHDGPALIVEIAEGTGIPTANVKTTLNRGKGTRFQLLSDGSGGRGRQNAWAAAAQ